MAVAFRHHVHEGQGLVVLMHFDARNLAAQDLGEDVVLIVRHVSPAVGRCFAKFRTRCHPRRAPRSGAREFVAAAYERPRYPTPIGPTSLGPVRPLAWARGVRRSNRST